MKKIEKDIFEVVAYSGKATFKRDEQAKLKGVTIEIDDLVLEGTKEESSSLSLTKLKQPGK